jgi:signal transduction histidine kinase
VSVTLSTMFTSLRSRLWLSYAFVITIALGIVAIVLFVFLLRNPFASREIQQRLRNAQSQITATPQKFIDNPNSLEEITQTYNVRTLVFNSARQLVFDSNSDIPPLPFPRRNPLGRNVQNARDANGEIWLYTSRRLSNDQILVVAAPRPRVPVLNIFTDELLIPILQGGLIALLLSLILAFAIARWVADPLQEVVVASRNYPSEEMKPISPRGPHEVQDLTHAFNSMVTRVESSQKSQRDFVANVSHELRLRSLLFRGLLKPFWTIRPIHPKRVNKPRRSFMMNQAVCIAWRLTYSIWLVWKRAQPI